MKLVNVSISTKMADTTSINADEPVLYNTENVNANTDEMIEMKVKIVVLVTVAIKSSSSATF